MQNIYVITKKRERKKQANKETKKETNSKYAMCKGLGTSPTGVFSR